VILGLYTSPESFNVWKNTSILCLINSVGFLVVFYYRLGFAVFALTFEGGASESKEVL
jgi:hypothetical protein